MKAKKWISALLAAVMAVTMLFAGSVTAGAEETASGETPSYKVYYTPAEYVNKEENKPYVIDPSDMKGLSGYDQCVITGLSYEEAMWIFKNQDSYNPFWLQLSFGSSSDWIRLSNDYIFDKSARALYASSSLGGDTVAAYCGFAVSKVAFAIDQNKLPDDVREKLKKLKSCTLCTHVLDLNKSKYITFQKEVNKSADIPEFECEFIYNDGMEHPDDPADSTEDEYPSFEVSAISDQIYTGKARKPSVTVTDGNKTLKEDTDYTVSYQNNKEVGTATCVVTGKGKYSWLTCNTDFQIVPKKTTLTAKKSGEKITLSWKKVDGAEKYQIYYREKGDSKYKKLTTVSGSKTSYSTSKLDKNKTYQFKIRSYAESGGKKYYSSYSKVVTTK